MLESYAQRGWGLILASSFSYIMFSGGHCARVLTTVPASVHLLVEDQGTQSCTNVACHVTTQEP